MKNSILLVALLVLLQACGQQNQKQTQVEVDKTTTGYMEEQTREVVLNTGMNRSGIEVYEYTCIACHGKTTQGAPIPGDKDDWDVRKKQGMDTLLEHAIKGYGDFMPKRGGCFNCNDDELLAAIKYMIELPEIRLDLNIRM
jgi:cytochrome c5